MITFQFTHHIQMEFYGYIFLLKRFKLRKSRFSWSEGTLFTVETLDGMLIFITFDSYTRMTQWKKNETDRRITVYRDEICLRYAKLIDWVQQISEYSNWGHVVDKKSSQLPNPFTIMCLYHVWWIRHRNTPHLLPTEELPEKTPAVKHEI